MKSRDKPPPPGGGDKRTESQHEDAVGPSSSTKRNRDSPEKIPKAKKQTTMLNYWLGHPQTQPNLSENRFSILDTDDIEESSEPIQKLQKPPPIFIDGVSVIQPLYEMLNEIAKDAYDIRIVSSNQVKIQVKTAEIYKIVVKELESKDTQFYTYKPKEERCFKVVLRNMHPSVNQDELTEELNEMGHHVTNIWNVKHRVTKAPLPMFMIELSPNSNNKNIYDIRHLLHCRISFEPPRPKRSIPQCGNCQQYGHTKSYCHRLPKCVKCAGNHLTMNCHRTTRSDSVKCALCLGNHPANYKGCSVYQELKKSKNPPPRVPKYTRSQIEICQENNSSKYNGNSYADKVKQNQNIDTAPKNSTSDMTNMMQMLQQIMQQLMTLTNLLVNIMPKAAQSSSTH